ncbi:MAG: hypothetical protein ACE5E5_07750 [Phycisphaerae bacterium]
MDSLVEAKVKHFLKDRLNYPATDCGAIMYNIRKLARAGGHALDERFARAGLGAGVEARLASEIVDRALGGGGGSASSEGHMKIAIDEWVRKTPPMGV